MKKVYYARPINIYGTKEDERNLNLIKSLGFEIHDPYKPELQQEYKTEGMSVFFKEIKKCDILIFKSLYNGKITAGVYKEIKFALDNNIKVIEIPSINNDRVLSVEDTRLFLKNIGYR